MTVTSKTKFDTQAAALHQQCAERRGERETEQLRARIDLLLKKNAALRRKARRQHLRAMAAEQLAARVQSAVTEAEEIDQSDARLIVALDKEGVPLRDIADKFETDLLTIAYLVEVSK